MSKGIEKFAKDKVKGIKENIEFWEYDQSVEKIVGESMKYWRLGGPLPSKEISLSRSFYLFLDKIIPERIFRWAYK